MEPVRKFLERVFKDLPPFVVSLSNHERGIIQSFDKLRTNGTLNTAS
jgi:hypothetical protein